jgi:AraC family transcriptional regulator, regulatory protein of adaptative response / DNA-3-methyladenine glycosylase II
VSSRSGPTRNTRVTSRGGRAARLRPIGRPAQIASHLSHDPKLRPLLNSHQGLRVPGLWDGFEVAVRAALGQRLTIVDSNSLAGRLVRNFGRPIETSIDGLTHLFTRPEDLAGAELTPLGTSRKSSESIQALARALINKEFTFESFRTLEETVSRDGPLHRHACLRRAGLLSTGLSLA